MFSEIKAGICGMKSIFMVFEILFQITTIHGNFRTHHHLSVLLHYKHCERTALWLAKDRWLWDTPLWSAQHISRDQPDTSRIQETKWHMPDVGLADFHFLLQFIYSFPFHCSLFGEGALPFMFAANPVILLSLPFLPVWTTVENTTGIEVSTLKKESQNIQP